MARHSNGRGIKRHRIYTVWEIAEVLNVHRQTVIRWIKDKGLVAERATRPWLIRGDDLKSFLQVKRVRNRHRLALHHLYCLGCKQPQEPAGRMADYSQQTAMTGMITALCPACSALMQKVIRRVDLEAIRAKLDVTVDGEDVTYAKAHR